MSKEFFHSYQECDTIKWAKEYASTLHPDMVVCLEGDIGTGKTVLARGIAQGLGVHSVISSPTFTLVNTYNCKNRDGKLVQLHHFDLYRIHDADELFEIGWDEYFNENAICLIEWSERAGNLLPITVDVIHISRVIQNETSRIIILQKNINYKKEN